MIQKSKNKVNHKARLSRHLRVIKENKNNSLNIKRLNLKKSFQYNFVLLIIFFLAPIYPTLSSFFYDTSSYDFYRWDIDEKSIIESYYWWLEDDISDFETPILESSDSFLSVNTILWDERDISWNNEIIDYEVKPWESFYSISYKFKVSTNPIYWANDFPKSHTLQPWELIKIPPVSWLIHQVVSWDTLSSIAKKYKIEEDKIVEQNKILTWSSLVAWEVLVIPWAIKEIPKPKYVAPKTVAKTNTTWYNFASSANSQFTDQTGAYKLVRRKPQHTFYWWNCTRYVWQYKNVNWWGNANRWIKNAKAKWHLTWTTPKIWAIVQFGGRWYNPWYWHVWIVMDIVWDNIIVSDMNYRRINEITYRKVPINDRSIEWYIYVD